MKLLRQSVKDWQYLLPQNEADILLGLVRKFPFTGMDQVKISRTDADPKTAEREKLLNESLADHRQELKQLAMNLLGGEKWKPSGKGQLLTLDLGSREALLQILNDIRVGCWRALGEPEALDVPMPHATPNETRHRHLMDLAGYFEMGLLEPGE